MNIVVTSRVVMFGVLWNVDMMLQAMGRLSVARGVVPAPAIGIVDIVWWRDDVENSLRESGATTATAAADFAPLLDESACIRQRLKHAEFGDELDDFVRRGLVDPTCHQLAAPLCSGCASKCDDDDVVVVVEGGGHNRLDLVVQSVTRVDLSNAQGAALREFVDRHRKWLEAAVTQIRDARGTFCATCWSAAHRQAAVSRRVRKARARVSYTAAFISKSLQAIGCIWHGRCFSCFGQHQNCHGWPTLEQFNAEKQHLGKIHSVRKPLCQRLVLRRFCAACAARPSSQTGCLLPKQIGDFVIHAADDFSFSV